MFRALAPVTLAVFIGFLTIGMQMPLLPRAGSARADVFKALGRGRETSPAY